jgi:hypothetical protein
MLRACHERIQRQCATLAKLATHLRSDGLTDVARQAAADIHRYFSSAGRQHHADEEQDLFPLLRNAPDLDGLLETLAREHAVMESLWLRLDRQLPARSTSSIHGVVEPLLAAPGTISTTSTPLHSWLANSMHSAGNTSRVRIASCCRKRSSY